MAEKAQKLFSKYTNVHIIHAAACEKNGSVTFNIHDDIAASSIGQVGDDHRRTTGNRIHPVNAVVVPAINLYNFLVSRGVKYIDFYQSDIQGMDFAVLSTLMPMIESRSIKTIKCETERDEHEFQSYDDLPSTRQALFRDLLERSYGISKRQKVGPNWVHQDITWKLRPGHMLKWYLRRLGLA